MSSQLSISQGFLSQDLLQPGAVSWWQGNVQILKSFCQARHEEHNFKFQLALQQPVRRSKAEHPSPILKQEANRHTEEDAAQQNINGGWECENVYPLVGTQQLV